MRSAIDSDLPSIKALLDRAFAPSAYESRLADCLFSGSEAFRCFLEEESSRIVSCVFFTPALRGERVVGYHLAPVAVEPALQRKGYGTKLLLESLNVEPISKAPVFVLGDPRFYERFGFAPVSNPTCPYDPSNEHFRALRWDPPLSPFTVGYGSAFAEAEQT